MRGTQDNAFIVLATVVPPSHQVCCLKTKHCIDLSVVQRNEFHWAVKGIFYSLAFPEPVNSEEIHTYSMIYTYIPWLFMLLLYKLQRKFSKPPDLNILDSDYHKILMM